LGKVKGVEGEGDNRMKNNETLFYVKTFNLTSLKDVELIKEEVSNKFILIIKVTPLAERSIEELRKAIDELYHFTLSLGGDIARFGEERVIITPPGVKIWRGLMKD